MKKDTSKSRQSEHGDRPWWKDYEVLSSSYGVVYVAHTLEAARELRSRGYGPSVEL